MTKAIMKKYGKRVAFLKGASRLLEIFPSNSAELERIVSTSDAEALSRDWQTIGDDLRSVYQKFEKEVGSETRKESR